MRGSTHTHGHARYDATPITAIVSITRADIQVGVVCRSLASAARQQQVTYSSRGHGAHTSCISGQKRPQVLRGWRDRSALLAPLITVAAAAAAAAVATNAAEFLQVEIQEVAMCKASGFPSPLPSPLLT
jgi:hypothetical protein